MMEKQLEKIAHFNNVITGHSGLPGDFYINKREDVPVHSCLSSYRRDFYKISFITSGEGLLTCGGKAVHIGANTLIISNPNTPFLWKPTTEKQTGFFCLFTKHYIEDTRQNASVSTLLNANQFVFPLKQDLALFIESIFLKIYATDRSEYLFKNELYRSYIQLITHEIIKEFGVNNYQTYSSSERISRMFQNLLENHMLVNSVSTEITMKTPQQFADRLSVHVNHLNRALKEYTGKTTSGLITERVLREAQSLLAHTDWSIAEIAYCLGFKHPSSFQTFFKKQTNQSPKEYRQSFVSLK